MKRKIAFYGLIIVILIGIFTLIYNLIKPDRIKPNINNKITGELQYSEVESFVYEQETQIYLFFFSNNNDADSDYVVTKFLIPLLEKYKLEDFSTLHYVDLAELEAKSDSPDKYLRNHFGFTRYPTFIAITIDKDGTKIEDVLEWQPLEPYTMDVVEQWLINHQVIAS